MTAPSKPKRRVKGVTKDSALARQKILDAAIDQFARHGYKGASTEQIAEQAGYGQATVFFHFKTKEGLLQACLERQRENLTSSVPPKQTQQGTIEVLRAIDNKYSENSTQAFFSRVLGDVLDNESILSIYTEFHGKVRALISEELSFETGAKQREADYAAAALLCMMIGVHIEYPVEHTKYSRDDYSDMLALVGSLLLEHLRANGLKLAKPKAKLRGRKPAKPRAAASA